MFLWNSLVSFYDPSDVGNLISGSSAFSKTSLNIWKFTVHVLLKPGLEIIHLITPPQKQLEKGDFHSQPQTVVKVLPEKETPVVFPGSSEVRTSRFHCQRQGFNPR